MGIVPKYSIYSLFLVLICSVESHGWTYNDLSGYLDDRDRDAFQQYMNAGTIVSRLPTGAQAVVIENTQYYVANGVWFLPIRKTATKYATKGEKVIQFIVVLPPV